MAGTHFVRNRKIQDYSESRSLAGLRRNLRVGDVILTSPPDDAIRPIAAFQNAFPSFPAAARKFTHVAIYIGNDQIVHAMLDERLDSIGSGGVKRELLGDLFQDGATFAVLRSDVVQDGHAIVIAQAACAHLGAPYDYKAIVRCIAVVAGRAFGVTRGKTRWLKLGPAETDGLASPKDLARAFVCSDLIYSIFDEIYQYRNPCNYRGGHPAPIHMPCSFYANPNFRDVDIDA